MAIITRWHMPPENWCAYCRARRSGSGIPTSASISMRALAAFGLRQAGMQDEKAGDLLRRRSSAG